MVALSTVKLMKFHSKIFINSFSTVNNLILFLYQSDKMMNANSRLTDFRVLGETGSGHVLLLLLLLAIPDIPNKQKLLRSKAHHQSCCLKSSILSLHTCISIIEISSEKYEICC
jgi:hypothetical protein